MSLIEITYTRGHGPGGQHKNKVETCVVAFHPKTGMREVCQDTRSQAQNRKIAVARLKRRIAEWEEDQIATVKESLRREAINMGVIRTYNYARNEVKDHRTGKKANLKQVLNGNLNLINDDLS